MDIYLIDPSGSQLQLPVNPEEITIRRERLIETVSILDIGEVDFPIGGKKSEISFSSFFPKEYDQSYCRYAELPDPQEAMNQLTTWMYAKKPIRIIITETVVNVLALLSAHQSQFKGGEPGDVYYEITLRPWNEVKVRTLDEATAAQNNGTALKPRSDTKPAPKVYTVRAGDSLWAIAKLQLGDGGRWREIYDKNKGTIGPDPNKIQVGAKLVMP